MTDDAIKKAVLDLIGERYYNERFSQFKDEKWEIVRSYCFLMFSLGHRGSYNSFRPSFLANPFKLPIESVITSILHLPGLRGTPERTYKKTAVGAKFPGTFDAYTASVIHEWQSSDGEQRKKLTQLSKQLEELGLTWKVEARPLDDAQVELRVARLPHSTRGGAKDLVSVADVGFGVSQVLPVLVALLTGRRGQIVYLEQPEIHLHPRAQRRMASMLADAAKRGVIVVVETHSSLLLQGIQTLVAKGALDPDLVRLHWFSRDDKTGSCEVESTTLDQDGAFGSWPADFDEVMLESDSEYLDAVEQRRAGTKTAP